MSTPPLPAVSVVMPTFRHAHFIGRAVESLLAQGLRAWELIVVDDASPDDTHEVLTPYLADPRIRYCRLACNSGLGAALNAGLEEARAPLIAYLPSDDLYFADHLSSLVAALEGEPVAVLAYSGVKHHYNRSCEGILPEHGLQLVQTVHRATAHRWVERTELVTDDLDRMLWDRLRGEGTFVGTGRITCEWVDHPDQLHKLLREPIGGINRYRQRFAVGHPLRFHTRIGNPIDEVAQYRHYRDRPAPPPAPDGLKILLVGELAYNADRILALEELGHRLYGLWMPDPYWFNTVGPLPFGHVQDLPADDWEDAVRRLQPDVIYALLNWQAVPFAHHVMRRARGIPFVWHFKEGPFICIEKGTWRELVELTRDADGRIYSSPEMRDWFELMVPGLRGAPCSVIDGDLPKRDWFAAPRAPRLSQRDGEMHTVVPGRPIGLHPHSVAELKDLGIHLHFYGDFTQGQWRGWIETTRRLAGSHLHLHSQVDQGRWVEEFSRYDAGWLHFIRSDNGGDLRRASWDDLNYPARIATLVAAGLPLLQHDNRGAIVATQSLASAYDIGIAFSTFPQLAERLADAEAMRRLQENVWSVRTRFTFDHHAPALVAFLREAIAAKRPGMRVGKAPSPAIAPDVV